MFNYLRNGTGTVKRNVDPWPGGFYGNLAAQQLHHRLASAAPARAPF